MGNYFTNPSSKAAGRVILWDGRVHEFEKPLTVAELMLEYPQQVVVEFRSDLSEKRPTPLPADKKLDMKKVYLMLPMKRGKPVLLSSEEARHVLSVLRSRSFLSSSRFLPLFARICPAGGIEEGQTSTTTKFVSERKENESELMLPEILENRPEYLSRQLSGKGWKPSLDTIKEKKVEKKIPHWLFNFQA
ncbi:hypothetical protein P3X46_003276 [Hevea brasiliensis]|uniref:Multidrug resistance protein ABC transporter family protein n=1 Tax=Hevea brasiliensis TaxID=3981 RepID=A0ABQ9N5Q5_HEVBR|nr:uncharacterized protein LOC110657972 [Hevea brasiliensis]KAJ9187861.1 hypothetical protein P3X46_003276 [Hevea brasiliensis]